MLENFKVSVRALSHHIRVGDAAFILYNRRQLLEYLSVLQAGLKCVSQAREAQYRDQSLRHSGERVIAVIVAAVTWHWNLLLLYLWLLLSLIHGCVS